MPQGTCSVLDCDGITGIPGTARGWCMKCYQRWQRTGDPTGIKRIFGDIEARFWSHVDRRGDDECWLSTASVDSGGYGTFGVEGKVRKAHSWVYEHYVGPIPKDRPHLDHACHTLDKTCAGGMCFHRRCVNYLRHLEPVTGKENAQRARMTKFTDEYTLSLHARWMAGERAKLLAVEAGTTLQYLYRLFRAVTPYEPGSYLGKSRAPAASASSLITPDSRPLIAVTGQPQELPGLFVAAS